jgi:hypothetical protein
MAVSVPTLETDLNLEPDPDYIWQFFLMCYKQYLAFLMSEGVLFLRKLASHF